MDISSDHNESGTTNAERIVNELRQMSHKESAARILAFRDASPEEAAEMLSESRAARAKARVAAIRAEAPPVITY